jgi:urease accessory protein
MLSTDTALTLLQYGDSAYPAGGFAFSWGMEGLAADGKIHNRDDVSNVIEEHLTFRWQTMDRPLLAQTYSAVDVDAIVVVDRFCDAATLSAEMRDGSRRAGRALLGTSARLGGQLSCAYRAVLGTDRRLGHLPIVQAVVYRDAGLSLESARLLSGWSLVTALASAATRLGIIGHIEAQQILKGARSMLAALLADVSVEETLPSSFTPLIDIAISRGSARHVRLFGT